MATTKLFTTPINPGGFPFMKVGAERSCAHPDGCASLRSPVHHLRVKNYNCPQTGCAHYLSAPTLTKEKATVSWPLWSSLPPSFQHEAILVPQNLFQQSCGKRYIAIATIKHASTKEGRVKVVEAQPWSGGEWEMLLDPFQMNQSENLFPLVNLGQSQPFWLASSAQKKSLQQITLHRLLPWQDEMADDMALTSVDINHQTWPQICLGVGPLFNTERGLGQVAT